MYITLLAVFWKYEPPKIYLTKMHLVQLFAWCNDIKAIANQIILQIFLENHVVFKHI